MEPHSSPRRSSAAASDAVSGPSGAGVDELFTDDIQSYYNSADLNATAEAEVRSTRARAHTHTRRHTEGPLPASRPRGGGGWGLIESLE